VETDATEPVLTEASPDSPSAADLASETQPPAEDPHGAQPDEPAAAPLLEAVAPSDPSLTAPEPPVVTRTPWSLRVDGQRVDLEGAYLEADEIRIPREVWERQIQPNYMGDRRVWQREREHFNRQLQALADDNRPEVIRANLFADRFLAMAAMDPMDRDEAWETLLREIPIVEANARVEAAERRARAYEGQVTQQYQQETAEAVVPVLHDTLGQYVTNALQHETLKGLGLSPEELHKALWDEFGLALFEDADATNADFQTPAGGVRMDMQRIDRFLTRQGEAVRHAQAAADQRVKAAEKDAAEARAQIKKAQEAAEAAKRNAQVLAPTPKDTPVVTASGSPSGTPDPAPWRDRTKTREEQIALYNEHMKAQNYPTI
jgi:hypothetical protein